MANDPKTGALALLKEETTGVLATISSDGSPRARTLYFTSDDAFNIFFLTFSGTQKVSEINADHRAAFVVSAPEKPQTLQIEGTISELTDTAVISPVVRILMDTLMKGGPHFAPLTHLDSGRVLFYKLTPSRVRFGDYTHGEGTEEVLLEIPLS